MCCTGRCNKRQWDSRESDEEEDNCEVDVVSSLESLSLFPSRIVQILTLKLLLHPLLSLLILFTVRELVGKRRCGRTLLWMT